MKPFSPIYLHKPKGIILWLFCMSRTRFWGCLELFLYFLHLLNSVHYFCRNNNTMKSVRNVAGLQYGAHATKTKEYEYESTLISWGYTTKVLTNFPHCFGQLEMQSSSKLLAVWLRSRAAGPRNLTAVQANLHSILYLLHYKSRTNFAFLWKHK